MKNINKVAIGLVATSMLTIGSASMANASAGPYHPHHKSISNENPAFSYIKDMDWEDSPVCGFVTQSKEVKQQVVCPTVNVKNSPYSLVIIAPHD